MKLLRFVAGLGVSAALLWLAFRDVDATLMWAAMRGVRLDLVAVYVLSLVVVQVARVLRWGVLIRPFATLRASQLFRIANIGHLLIFALPLRLGELARPYLLKKECGASLTSGLASIVVERGIDGLVVTLLFFATTFMLDARYEVPSALVVGAYVALGVFATLTAALAVILAYGERSLAWAHVLVLRLAPRLGQRVERLVVSFVAGARALRHPRAQGLFALYTLIYWGANGLGFYVMLRALALDGPLIAGFVMVSVLGIAVMIPAGPGHLGTFQGSVAVGLSIFGVGTNDAAAYNMVAYPLVALVQVAFGLPYLVGRGVVREVVGAAP